jgi:short-subunit dehydrogenase
MDYEYQFLGRGIRNKRIFTLYQETGDGHIINISSLFGLTAQPTQSAYNASKFAVRGFTESLRQELDIENCGVSHYVFIQAAFVPILQMMRV